MTLICARDPSGVSSIRLIQRSDPIRQVSLIRSTVEFLTRFLHQKNNGYKSLPPALVRITF